MATEKTGGTTAALTLDSETTLATITDAGTYVLWVNTSNMVKGDIIKVRAKTKIRTGSSSLLAAMGTYRGAQTVKVKPSLPIDSPFEVIFTIEQTDGTGRAYEWSVHQI